MNNQNPQLILTACNFETRQTQAGTKVLVMMLFNDLIYLKGELKFKKDGGMWLEIANSPWKDKNDKWQNNYRGGFANEDFKKNLEAQVIANYQSGQVSIVMPNMRTNYDAATYLHPKVPAQPPVQGQQQFNPQQYAQPQYQQPIQQQPMQYPPQGYAQPQAQPQPFAPPQQGNNNAHWGL